MLKNSADFLKRKSFGKTFAFATGLQVRVVKINNARRRLVCGPYPAWPLARAGPRAFSFALEIHVFLRDGDCSVGMSSAAFPMLLGNLKCSTAAFQKAPDSSLKTPNESATLSRFLTPIGRLVRGNSTTLARVFHSCGNCCGNLAHWYVINHGHMATSSRYR